MAVSTTSRDERVARARAALAHAELRTGARSVLTPPPSQHVDPAAVLRLAGDPSGPASSAEPPASEGLVGLESPRPEPSATADVDVDADTMPTPRRTSLLTAERPALPVPDQLAEVLPDGLRRGATTAVLGSTSLVLTLLAHACSGGAWAAVVGQPTIGLLAAAQAGVALDRLALVPRPGTEAVGVLAALVDGVDVVVVGPDVMLGDADRRRLSARARERGAVLLPTVAWAGASTVLTVEHARWTGVGAGDGRLRTHSLRVSRTGRGSAAVPHAIDVTLPLSPGAAVRSDAARPVAEQAPERALRLVG
ncbi:hypothetical protein IC607_08765 [Cellulomonas sp. JH27-2]|nr:hypothetical protein [Cellulomonas sp. JH27-2]